MDSKRKKYLNALEIPVWELKTKSKASSETSIASDSQKAISSFKEICTTSIADSSSLVQESSIPHEWKNWDQFKQIVLHCTLCDLSKTRTQVVFGTGDLKASLMLIGEAPGATEDAQGLPFVGRAGLLLNSMLEALRLKRESVFITNIVKCRPPNNREPAPHEVKMCTPYLKHQIAVIRPKLIVALGRVAAQFLLETQESLGRLRKKEYQYGEFKIPLLITYHPAYLLRSPKEKSKAYEDWREIRKRLDELN